MHLHIFTPIPCYDIHEPFNRQSINVKLYLNTPILYRELLDAYKVIPNETKEGFVFEAAALTQIIYLIQDNINITYYYIRTVDGDLEYDLVVQTTTYVYLIDFKRSSSKNNKYKDSKEVISYYNNIDSNLEFTLSDCIFIENDDISYKESYSIYDYLEFIKNLVKSTNTY